MSGREFLQRNGYALISGVFTRKEVGKLIDEWEEIQKLHADDEALLGTKKGAFAARNLLRIWPSVGDILRTPTIQEILLSELGSQAGIVRALFFDKPPGNSWALPWHKDLMVAVKEHGIEGYFRNSSIASGIPQVKAPRDLLEKMLTIRIHLDDMTEANGPLRVLGGSHNHYEMAEDDSTEPLTITCNAGDVLLMRPLLTHASGRSAKGITAHRRILHFECARSPHLPDGYQWQDFVTLT